MADRLRVVLDGGKYTFVQPEIGGAYALRYGEPWRDCCGDGLILSLAYEVQELREKLTAMTATTGRAKPVTDLTRDELIAANMKWLTTEDLTETRQ